MPYGYSCLGKEYKTWLRIKERCYNPNHIAYHKYGAKGIVFEFVNSFEEFVKEVGPCPGENTKEWSIDRINPNLGYVRGNMMWLERKFQLQNRGKNCRNTSGVTGVYSNGIYWVAEWWCNGSRKRSGHKTFEEACKAREEGIKEANLNGARYTEFHGK